MCLKYIQSLLFSAVFVVVFISCRVSITPQMGTRDNNLALGNPNDAGNDEDNYLMLRLATHVTEVEEVQIGVAGI